MSSVSAQKEFRERQSEREGRVCQYRTLVRDTSPQARECRPENSVVYIFISKGKVGRGEKTTFFFILQVFHY